MLLYPIGSYKTNADLADFQRRNPVLLTPEALRRSINIAVIDDQPFLPEQNLKSFGYSIESIGDLKTLQEVRRFPIVLCDLMGVGHRFDGNRQGASIIEEVRTQYPSIIVVAYTGSSMASAQMRHAKQFADVTIRKDVDISEWKAALDPLVTKARNPAYIWDRVRLRLVEMEVDTKDILILEDAYVRSVLNKDSSGKRITSGLQQLDVAGDARAVVQGLISSAIFALLSS